MTIHAEYPTPKGVGVAPAADWVEAHGGIDELDNCKRYSERTDSVEQVLNEAIDGCDEILGIFDNMNNSGLLQYGDYSQLFDQICCINERIETARDCVLGLEALGVEV